jgi:uncharacterized RDD family membrane protein YckC
MQKANPIKLKPTPKPFSGSPQKKTSITEQIASKMTSPTLVEFRSQNAQLPEWRLQLQNAVQQRLKSESDKTAPERPVSVAAPTAEPAKAPEAGPVVEPKGVKTSIDNQYLTNALKRIESSRNRYLVAEQEVRKAVVEDASPKKDYPFTIAARTENPSPDTKDPKAAAPVSQIKPKLVTGKKKAKLIKDLYDTSELNPDFPPARLSSSFSTKPAVKTDARTPAAKAPVPDAKPSPDIREEKIEIKAPENPAPVEDQKAEIVPEVEERVDGSENTATFDEFDDYAPFSLRFNAGFFDLLIGSFMSFILLIPFIAAGGNWFTFSGFLAFAATCSIVMFIYLTASVGLAGKSFGMHLFSLEVIDIGGETYPSLHQSAVSAVVYLISTACLGIGFITALFDEDRRAAHDLLSGTLVVREL